MHAVNLLDMAAEGVFVLKAASNRIDMHIRRSACDNFNVGVFASTTLGKE